eukprot:417007-Prorocentrum_minimum.AAC.1
MCSPIKLYLVRDMVTASLLILIYLVREFADREGIVTGISVFKSVFWNNAVNTKIVEDSFADTTFAQTRGNEKRQLAGFCGGGHGRCISQCVEKNAAGLYEQIRKAGKQSC